MSAFIVYQHKTLPLGNTFSDFKLSKKRNAKCVEDMTSSKQCFLMPIQSQRAHVDRGAGGQGGAWPPLFGADAVSYGMPRP